MAVRALFAALLCAGCLAPVPDAPGPEARSGDPSQDPIAAAMLAYLAGPYPRADAVDWDVVHVTRTWELLVGDVPLAGADAIINADEKQAVAYFWRANLTPILTPGTYVPSYQEVTGQPIGYDLMVALRAANETDVLEATVELRAPPGMPATQEREADRQKAHAMSVAFLRNVTAEVRAMDGVRTVTWDENATYPAFRLEATPAAMRLVAQRPDVSSMDGEHPPGQTFFP